MRSSTADLEKLRCDAEAFYSDYEPLEILGRGLSSVVRRCLNRETHDEYAVKIIDLLQEEAPTIDEVQNEIDLLNELDGAPYVIHLFDVYQTETYVFLVFELMKCELFEHLNSVIRLRETDAKIAAQQLFVAIEELHRRNIIHRDIKLENVLIDENMNLKLTDFGFALKLDPDENLRALCGTPAYMAPEMLRCACDATSEGYSFPADMWSCGVLLATLLSGSAPFYHRRELIMLRTIMAAKFTLSGPEWRNVSEMAKNLVEGILCLDVKKRLTAAQALAHPWFDGEDRDNPLSLKKSFNSVLSPKKSEKATKRAKRALRRFRAVVHAALFAIRLKALPVTVENLIKSPYSTRIMREQIDGLAFDVYRHWVKRNTSQDRTAMFQQKVHFMVKENVN